MAQTPIATLMLAALAALVSGCSPSSNFGLPRGLDLPATTANQIRGGAQSAALPQAQGEVIGNGPVRVALLLPLTGAASVAGQSMANSARLAMEHVVTTGGQNVHLVLKDTAGDTNRARTAAQQAANEGAKLVLGPLRAAAVASAGEAARTAGIPLIGFSNTASVAGDGVYLLSILPEAEMMRSLSYVSAQGRRSAVALVPATAYGTAHEAALRQAAAEMNFALRGVHRFENEAQARQAVQAVIPLIKAGQVDTLFLPDRATAPSFGILLEAAQVSRSQLTIVGSADWDGDPAILGQNYLAGAIYPAADPAGLTALSAQYRPRFSGEPHPLSTLAYTGVLLANNSMLAGANPPYGPQIIASPTGFRGRDGLFRFHFDGRGEYSLAIKQVQPQGAVVIDGARLGGLTREAPGRSSSSGGSIPPASQFQ